MAVGNPFGQPLFNRLGLGMRFDGVNGTPSNPMGDVVYSSTLGEDIMSDQPEASLTALNQATAQSQGTMARVPGPDPFNGRPVPRPGPAPLLNPNQLPTFLGRPSIPNTGNQIVQPARQPGAVLQDLINSYAAMSPEDAAFRAQMRLAQRDVKPPAVQKFLSEVARGNYDFSSLNALNPNRPTTGLALSPLPPPVDGRPRPSAGTFNLDANSIGGIDPTGPAAHLLGPGPGQPSMNVPMQRPPGLSSTTRPSLFSMFNSGLNSIAFPSLAPSRPSTFTGAFGGNNPMNNNSMSGGTNSNQPLSQQIPQAVQQAVTPLLQNTATQLNQGIGSMVNQHLIGGSSQPFGAAFGGPRQTPPLNMSQFLLG